MPGTCKIRQIKHKTTAERGGEGGGRSDPI